MPKSVQSMPNDVQFMPEAFQSMPNDVQSMPKALQFKLTAFRHYCLKCHVNQQVSEMACPFLIPKMSF